MTLPTVTPLEVLSRTDPDFKAKVNALFMTKLPTYTGQLNALALAIDALATTMVSQVAAAAGSANAAATQVGLAADQVALAAAQVELAANHAAAAAAAAGALPHVPWQLYTANTPVVSNVNRQIYRRIATGTTGTDPALDPSNWYPLGQNLAVDLAGSGTVDCGSGNYFYDTISANRPLTMINVPAAPVRYACFLEFKLLGGNWTLPAGSYWDDGITPEFVVGKRHLLCGITRNGGAVWSWTAKTGFGG